jgi:hypothetical protein
MLPTMMLAALIPCAGPGTMDKEATARDCSGLLRGTWYDEDNPGKFLRCDGSSRFMAYRQRECVGGATFRLEPADHIYIFKVAWDDGRTYRLYLDFQGQEFRTIGAEVTVWRRRTVR